METPFVFGKIASEANFTNRKDELNRLVNNFQSGINTILISPRRWGKSSLVGRASEKATKTNKSLRFVFVDLFNVRTEEQFYELLAQEAMLVLSSKFEEIVDYSRKFLGRMIPKLSFSPTPESSFTLGLDYKEVKKQPEEILNLVEKIAQEKNWKIVVCIDEFQNIAGFDNPLAFQKKLRANWQKHQHVSYCLYGSKQHMMIEVFSSYSMPFYKFGDIIFLKKIHEKDMIPFICKRFQDTGKSISKEDSKTITTLTECHPYYVQQVSQQVWFRTEKYCSNEIVRDAFEGVVNQLAMLFQSIVDSLTNTQINFLHALVNNVERFSAKSVLIEYDLGTSANILRIKKSLVQKEIIDILGDRIDFIDPLFKYWIKKYYFKIRAQ